MRRDGFIHFADFPEFRPNLTPKQIFEGGAFGGTYFRPIHSGVTGRNYENAHREFDFGLDENLLTRPIEDVSLNKFEVHSGTSLIYWEEQGWIKAQDPFGWLQWFCRFYNGRRSPDDRRQIDRWLAFAGPKGRFFVRLVNMLKKAKKKHDDPKISPVIHQGLWQWARAIEDEDLA